MGENQRIIRLQCVQTKAEEVRLNHAIMCGLHEVLAAGQLTNPSDIPPRTHLPLVAVIPDAGILRGIPPADLLPAVAGTIVGDDEFEILKRLIQEGIEDSFKKTIAVVKNQPDADERRSAH
jgi:hypothetical protein